MYPAIGGNPCQAFFLASQVREVKISFEWLEKARIQSFSAWQTRLFSENVFFRTRS
jgi:hypothetical protein